MGGGRPEGGQRTAAASEAVIYQPEHERPCPVFDVVVRRRRRRWERGELFSLTSRRGKRKEANGRRTEITFQISIGLRLPSVFSPRQGGNGEGRKGNGSPSAEAKDTSQRKRLL